MIDQIRKRDGRVVVFDQNKIAQAIFKAFQATKTGSLKQAKALADKVTAMLNQKFKDQIPGVEDVQDIVEQMLMRDGCEETAKAYILYRNQHREMRKMQNVLKLIDNYLDEADWRVRENSNMAYSLQGLNNHVSSIISAKYWLEKIYPPEIKNAHEQGDFHIHDLNTLAAYCCGWSLEDLLLRGFGGVFGKVESRPAKHLGTALGQAVNFIYTLQGEVAGAQAFSNFDTYLAPFVRHDQLSYQQVKQCLQEYVYNMNVPTRVGFQTPFSNITLDLVPPKILAEEKVIIAGKRQKEKYGELQEEMNMINRAFAEVMLEGDATGRVFTWPIPTYNISKDFDWDNPVLKPIWAMTAKYGIPYFANFVNSDMNPDDARSMCPLGGNEKVLIISTRGRGLEYSTIRNIYEGNSKSKNYWVYAEGKFVQGTFNKFKNQEMLKVILENNHTIQISKNHLNFVKKDSNSKTEIIKGSKLENGLYLPYSLKKHKGKGGNKELGYFVGAFAGDGSFDGEGSVVFSLENKFKKKTIKKLKIIAQKYFGANIFEKQHPQSQLYTLKIHSKAAVGLCKDFVSGKNRDKRYQARLFGMSLKFRQGVLEGHYETDGGNRHRIYTSSKKMVRCLNMLAATLGTTTSIYKDSREGRFGQEANYAVLIYQLNRKKYSKIWFKKGSRLWVRIKKIKPIKNNTAYCFERKRGKPIFTIGTTGVLTHNCRLRLDNRELHKRGGGLFGAYPLTGSVGVVTLNMSRIGYLSKTKKEFLKRVSGFMDLAQESLEIKRKVLERFTNQGLYPYVRHYLKNIKQVRGSYWANHFSTIGLLGMNEGLLNLMGENIASPKGRKFALEVLDLMRTKLVKYQKETDNSYNLEATPAEGASYRLAKIDKEQFQDIITAGNPEPYYTNSTHLPVNFTDDIFEALKLQDDLQIKYTGGTVLHGFLGEQLNNGETTKVLVKKIAENFHLPYFTITPTFSICPNHGYVNGEHFYCPKCLIKQPCEVYSRVVGYLRPVQQWHKGKQEEFKDRKEYDPKEIKNT